MYWDKKKKKEKIWRQLPFNVLVKMDDTFRSSAY